MWTEVVAAALVGAALLWLVIQPLITNVPRPMTLADDVLDPEETPRGRALLALKEIEFDRATGKLSDADYTALNARYSAAAVEALRVGTEPRCSVHGPRLESGARFCPLCGAGLIDSEGHCAQCAAIIPEGARFCPGCGTSLIAMH